ncbi:MAG: rhomboid family intramembrane serine protease [Bacteroidota bacterium]|nr:rhomboid family intramembrane serine protease [Bacteroidota bacterium]
MTITLIISVITAIISILGFSSPEFFDKLKFNAYDVLHSNQWYRFFTYGFLHANWFHLLINLMVFYSFGEIVEKIFQYNFQEKYILYFLLLYVGGLLLSIIPAFGKHKNDVFYNAIGASGAISGIIFASILLYPTGKIMFFFIPIGIPAPVFGILYLIYEGYMSKHGKDNIGHDAHLWGALFGLIYTIILKPSLVTLFFLQLGITL